ncbi:calcium-binding protein, partial [bacterium]|nr:calcium-binding protein [bacterium]
ERGGQIEVVDQQNRRVLASQSAAQTEKVMIIGRDGLQDRIEIDGSISAADLPGGIVAWGGHGGKDQLLVNGTQHDDVISLASLGSSVNGKSLLNQNFEEIIVRGQAGNDHLTAAGQQLGARLVLDGGAGNDRLEGSDGNDELFGGTGRDELVAGLGRDLLVGGPGNDVLTGDRNDRLVQDELRDRMEMAMRRTARPNDRSIPDAPPQSDNRQQNERERDRDAQRNTGPQRAEQRQDDLQAFMRRR